MFSFLRRKPDVEVVVEAGSSDTAEDAMIRWAQMNLLTRRSDMDFVRSEGKTMVLRGRPKQAEAFRLHYNSLKELGQV